MADDREAFKEQVKAANDIVEVVSSYVPLKKKGRLWWACCPFHGEKTPSFAVNKEEQYYYCYGCHEGGDVLKFVQKMNNLSFPETLNELARRANIPIPEQHRTPEDARRDAARKALLDANELAAKYFAACLTHTPFGAKVREYWHNRGITKDIIAQFSLGAAMPSFHHLLFNLGQRGVPQAVLLQAGLVRERQRGGGYYDAFRGRAMIPIKDARGRVVAFGGRVLDKSEPKYLNTGETVLFQKHNLLFGMDVAIRAIRQAKFAIVVEGYMDAISLHAAGVSNVVASLGTAFTPQQARLLNQSCERVVFNYDSDAAGKTSAVRAVSIAKQAGLQVQVLTVPEVKDPDEYVRRFGREAYEKLVQAALDGTEFQLRYTLEQQSLATYAGKVAAAKAALPFVTELGSDLLAQEYVRKLAQWLALDEGLLQEEYQRQRRGQRREAAVPVPDGLHPELSRRERWQPPQQGQPETPRLHPELAQLDRTDRAERRLVAVALAHPPFAPYYDPVVREVGFVKAARQTVWQQVLGQPQGNVASIRAKVLELGDRDALSEMVSILDTEMDTPSEQLQTTADECVRVLRQQALEREMVKHQRQAAVYAQTNDPRYLEELRLAEAAQRRKQELYGSRKE